jgi:hypothetical protein
MQKYLLFYNISVTNVTIFGIIKVLMKIQLKVLTLKINTLNKKLKN